MAVQAGCRQRFDPLAIDLHEEQALGIGLPFLSEPDLHSQVRRWSPCGEKRGRDLNLHLAAANRWPV